MKRLLFLALSFVSLLTYAQDDMYFTSSKKAKEAAQKKQAVDDDYKISDMLPREPRLVMPVPTTVDYNSNKRSEDEYNRRYVYGGDYQNAGGAEDVADSLAARIEAVGGAEDYYDMDDPELDYRYSRRLVRFHNPRLYVASPYYWDLYYGYGAWDYLYAPYDPWYWHYGWGYGWSWGPWDCWYGGIWGWHHPHAWAYWGWGPSWGIPHYHHVAHRNIVPREYNSSRGQMAAGRNIRTNPLGNGTLASRTNVMGARTNAQGNRTTAQGVRGNGTRGSYTDYTNSRTGRSAATNEGARSANTNRARENAAQRSTATRNNNQQPSRSVTNQNSSSRVNTNTRTNNTPTNTRSSVPSSSSSFGGGGARSGGGSFGGGGGGGARGGGGGGRR